MDSSSLIPFLFFVTFLLALIYGVVQYFKARKARAEHHHSASEKQERKEASGEPARR